MLENSKQKEFSPLEPLTNEWVCIRSAPFIKFEVAKVRIIYPFDMVSSLQIAYLADVLYKMVWKSRWTELRKTSVDVYARRQHLLEVVGGRWATSDDGTDFNESHTLEDMEQIIMDAVDELKPTLEKTSTLRS